MTQVQVTKIPTGARTTISAERTYSNRSNCVAGARKALRNPEARQGVEFEIRQGNFDGDAGRWRWFPIAPGPSVVETAIAAEVQAANGRIAKAIVNAVAAKPVEKIDTDGIPAFLKRAPETPEAAEKRRAKVTAPSGERVLKNPPDARTEHADKAALARDERGFRTGSKQAVLLSMAVAGWTTEAAICKKLGWKRCRTTLARVVERAGLELERRPVQGGKSEYRAVEPKAVRS